tara:strand:- start:5144 stop:5410 length:267 start_codon:yes stop_codon:yes gene_type:complete
MPVGKKQKSSPTASVASNNAQAADARERRRKTSLRSYYKRKLERSTEEEDKVRAQRRAREAKPENRQKKRDRMARLRLEQDHGIIEAR